MEEQLKQQLEQYIEKSKDEVASTKKTILKLKKQLSESSKGLKQKIKAFDLLQGKVAKPEKKKEETKNEIKK